MGDAHFRVWFEGRAASGDELARIEEIEVTQEMDAFWEAHMRIALCLDERGAWLHRPDEVAKPFSRVRIELDVGNGRFEPLIDGPLVSVDSALDSQPGRSTATMVVRDDSAFLHRDEEVEPAFENRLDSSIADELFRRFEQIDDTRIDATDDMHPSRMRRGTVLDFLRELAEVNDRHAYVLPGEKPGKSIGCFRQDPAGPASLPKLVMIGDDRNLANASITEDPEGPQRTRGQVLRASDQGIASFETSSAELGLMRDLPPLPADLTPRRLLHPADNTDEDPRAAATAQARRAGYVYHLSGQVVPGRYGAVLSPYNKVRVEAGATPYSGEYLITKVVHRITHSLYSQRLEAKADSVTEVSAAQVAESLGGNPSRSVSVSVGIF
jgi:hypothetical protein